MSNTVEALDPSKFTEAELLAALKTKQDKKNESREAYKKLVEENVPVAIADLLKMSQLMSTVKMDTFKFFEDILQIKNDVYGIKEKQQSHTFSTDDAEITIGFRVNDGWDDTVSAGIAKVNEFISSLAKDENSAALVSTVFNLLKKDAKGNLKGSRVLELQKLTETFNNPEFTDGVEIISKAYKPKKSVWFIEAYTIKDAVKTNIPLSMSAVEFPEGYEFDFNKNDKKTEACQ